MSDPDAKNLDEVFHNMWTVASNTKATKPLHHVSINPMKDERLTDDQVLKIVKRCEEKYGYKPDDHQHVIVEHIKDGRQHFHVIWNRVSMTTGKAVWPGHHWNKSKQAAREMEKELGLKRPMPKRMKKLFATIARSGRSHKYFGRYQTLKNSRQLKPIKLSTTSFPVPYPKSLIPSLGTQQSRPSRPFFPLNRKRKLLDQNIPDSEKLQQIPTAEDKALELLIWAWENKRFDILRDFGIILPEDYFEP